MTSKQLKQGQRNKSVPATAPTPSVHPPSSVRGRFWRVVSEFDDQ